MKAKIEGEEGWFHGPVRITDDLYLLPDGLGVYTTGAWVHCGYVKDGLFANGRRVSVNKKARVLKLVNTKY